MKTLKNVLSDKKLRDYCETIRTSTKDNVFSDECDGSVIKDNVFLNKKSRMIYVVGF